MNDFRSDDAWQRDVRNRVLVPHFYEVKVSGNFFLMDEGLFASAMQKRGVDTLIINDNGRLIRVEEKIVRWPKRDKAYSAFCLETESCTIPERESDGWMRYSQADYLLYCFHQPNDSLKLCKMDMQKLKKWFWENETRWPVFTNPKENRSKVRVVPIADVELGVGIEYFSAPAKMADALPTRRWPEVAP